MKCWILSGCFLTPWGITSGCSRSEDSGNQRSCKYTGQKSWSCSDGSKEGGVVKDHPDPSNPSGLFAQLLLFSITSCLRWLHLLMECFPSWYGILLNNSPTSPRERRAPAHVPLRTTVIVWPPVWVIYMSSFITFITAVWNAARAPMKPW